MSTKKKKKPYSLKAALVFPELEEQKKKIPLETVPSPLQNVPSPPKEPFDLDLAEHKLFRKFNLFHLFQKHTFPLIKENPVYETIGSFPEETLPSPLSVPKRDEIVSSALEREAIVALPDPWQKSQDLLLKCRIALEKRKLDYAQIYYEELKPFYSKLDSEKRVFVFRQITDMQQDLEMLKLSKLREILRRAR